MKATLVVNFKFQFFHLARQLEQKGKLEKLYTGYPKFKLKAEHGIPSEKLKTFPWLVTPYMFSARLNISKYTKLNNLWLRSISETLDRYARSNIEEKGVLIAMSGNGLNSGSYMQSIGGKFVCQRGSTHISFQDALLAEEYSKWGFKWRGIDPRIIEKERAEYKQADFITVPSEFARQSFIKEGINPEKIYKIPYGARLDRFKKLEMKKSETFTVLWVGAVSIRKGFMYALEAFEKLKYSDKKFVVIGALSEEINSLLALRNLTNVVFKGRVANEELTTYYNSANVFVLSSVEDGFGIVLSEALACGCPVIATENSGSIDLITDGKEGFIVPPCNSTAILEAFNKFIDNPLLRDEMSDRALAKVSSIGGWDSFGNAFEELINTF